MPITAMENPIIYLRTNAYLPKKEKKKRKGTLSQSSYLLEYYNPICSITSKFSSSNIDSMEDQNQRVDML